MLANSINQVDKASCIKLTASSLWAGGACRRWRILWPAAWLPPTLEPRLLQGRRRA